MTGKLYLENDSLSGVASVLSSTAAEDGRFHIRLAATLFHPQGGGQPSDSGYLGDAAVLGVFTEQDEIVHLTDRPLAVGEWPMRVDADARQLHTRMHSAGHLIAVAGEALGWKAIKANHRPGEGRVVFEAAAVDAAPPEALRLGAEANALVGRALPRRQRLEAGIRLIGWGDLPLWACGGTHVTRTDRVGEIVISAVKLRKGQLAVSYQLASAEAPSTTQSVV